MRCCITLLQSECIETECSLWNRKRNECSVQSFLSSWMELYIAVTKMQSLMERMEKEEEESD